MRSLLPIRLPIRIGRPAAGRTLLLALGAVAGLALALPSAAEDPAPAGSGPGLDELLRLPSNLDYGVERRGGATRSEWRARFAEARLREREAEAALRKAQEELAELGIESEAWTVGPPGVGAGGADAPLSFQLRQEIKRQEAEVTQARARLRDLEVEANLAGVPREWRIPSTESHLADDSVPAPSGNP